MAPFVFFIPGHGHPASPRPRPRRFFARAYSPGRLRSVHRPGFRHARARRFFRPRLFSSRAAYDLSPDRGSHARAPPLLAAPFSSRGPPTICHRPGFATPAPRAFSPRLFPPAAAYDLHRPGFATPAPRRLAGSVSSPRRATRHHRSPATRRIRTSDGGLVVGPGVASPNVALRMEAPHTRTRARARAARQCRRVPGKAPPGPAATPPSGATRQIHRLRGRAGSGRAARWFDAEGADLYSESRHRVERRVVRSSPPSPRA